jgi:hypothetical protein
MRSARRVLALRPWTWWDIQPGPPAHARSAPPATEAELLVLAALALLPVIVVILFAGHLTRASRLARDAGARAKGEGRALEEKAAADPGGRLLLIS